ncbi:VIT1/CCC1 transporter family protein [Paraglaciecola arctica]|uniref:Integral membrane protein n=1 Tax=Paraglaciecola arctica BSs20135 TaxID=493475 RepID=K6Z1J5_9ALTE|nr:VIT1/CCC1 transporter family protein [Paraglaciecola arctica]GAC17310.1 hypothetical protein GARC_0328 [Paraglaciecola arctica BSs20135]
MDIKDLISLTHSQGIIRRYFIVNGFDGALTMLGLILGFLFSDPTDIDNIINVCIGAAIALCVSGISSAYVSESAERQYVLTKLEQSMITDLSQTSHAHAARTVPIIIALVNGLAPFVISLLILLPLWLFKSGMVLPISPLLMSVLIAMTIIFLLGVFLSRVSGISWWRSGLRTLLVGILTAVLIFVFVGY